MYAERFEIISDDKAHLHVKIKLVRDVKTCMSRYPIMCRSGFDYGSRLTHNKLYAGVVTSSLVPIVSVTTLSVPV